MNIRWQDKNPDTEVLERAQMVLRTQLRWACHVVHMDEDRIRKAHFYYELVTEVRVDRRKGSN